MRAEALLPNVTWTNNDIVRGLAKCHEDLDVDSEIVNRFAKVWKRRYTHGGPNPPASRNESVAVPEAVDEIGLASKGNEL